MKANIHPTYHSQAKVMCACGNVFQTGSTQKEIKVEICAKCHPFFTGQQKLVDTEGRVDRYKRKVKTAEQIKAQATKKKKKTSKKAYTRPLTLREMLRERKEK